jgi:hypothetical protein
MTHEVYPFVEASSFKGIDKRKGLVLPFINENKNSAPYLTPGRFVTN